MLFFNRERFFAELSTVKKMRKKSYEKMAKEIGFNRHILAQAACRNHATADVVVKLAFWMDVDLREYVEVKALKPKEPELPLNFDK